MFYQVYRKFFFLTGLTEGVKSGVALWRLYGIRLYVLNRFDVKKEPPRAKRITPIEAKGGLRPPLDYLFKKSLIN